LKLLIVNHRDPFHPKAGGAERDLLETFSRLVKKGVDVYWLSEDVGRGPGEVSGIHLIRRGNPLTLHFRSLLEATKFDLVFDSVAHAVPFLSNLVNRCTVAKIHHVHQQVLRYELPPHLAVSVAWAERLSRFYKRVIVPSRSTGEEAVRTLKVRPERITVIPEGIDHSSYTPGEKSDEPFILWLHRMKRYKNPLHAIEVFRLAKGRGLRGVKLVVAGGGDLESQVREEAKRVEGVEVLGRVGEERKRELLRRAWLFMSTSFIEGWGLSVLEANASGTPAVGYRVGSLGEIIVEGVNGYTVPYGDLNKMADLLVNLFNDQRRLRAMWSSAYLESLKYDWEKTAEMYHEYIERLECIK